MKTEKYNDEVIYSKESITKIGSDYIDKLKEMAVVNTRKRMRLCCHNEIDDKLHEMLIIHAKGAYIPPHKHISKTESFHIIEGELKVVIFDDQGIVDDVINMGVFNSGKIFYYRIKEDIFHTVIPMSDYVVFHETTNGPFVRSEMIFAPWAPGEKDFNDQGAYLEKIKCKAASFIK